MMSRKRPTGPAWLIWDGDDFPRQIHSDSVVFFVNEHLSLDDDDLARQSLAKQLQQEGLVFSLSEAFNLINQSTPLLAGYRYENDDDTDIPIYCDNEDEDLDYDATFVEVPYV
jgi:hypothetical protein